MTACVLMWPGVRDGVEVVMARGHAIAWRGTQRGERGGETCVSLWCVRARGTSCMLVAVMVLLGVMKCML